MKEILNKMKEIKTFANLEVDYGSPMASAQFAAKKRAMEELESLQEQYTAKLIKETVAIIVTGDNSKEFSTSAENLGLISASLESSVIGVLESINKDIYLNQGLSIDLAMMVDSIFQEVVSASGLRANGIDLEKVQQGMLVGTKQQFIDTFLRLIIDSDPNVFAMMAMLSVSRIALENEVGKKSGLFPVVLTTNNELIMDSVRKSNLFKKVITASAGQSNVNNVDYSLEKVDENIVEKTLTSIKKSLKEKKDEVR